MDPDQRSIAGLTSRQKLILSGLYLSKFDATALENLGFDSFIEAFNVIGYALGSRPASLKNYRDEFDPLFPNPRKGWHKRPFRENCREIYEHYGSLELEDFTRLVKSFFASSDVSKRDSLELDLYGDGTSAFAQRLVTGVAAERYFETIYSSVPMFQGLTLENTTAFGCGYDFRLSSSTTRDHFLAVEVKGMIGKTGGLAMTSKEYEVAASLKDRFFLFVARNFRETPSHSIFQDPVSCGLSFRRTERVIVQVSWLTTL